MVEVRMVIKEDAAEILAIYSPYILNSATSFETEVPPVEQFQKRIEDCIQKYPWMVCVIDEQIAGYVYATKHREREAYQWTCECSVYIHRDFKGKEIGKELYQLLFQVLKLQQFRNVYAGITLPNEASIRLHEKCGFRRFATYENIGFKSGNWHSVGWWKLQINNYDLQPLPPLKISGLNTDLLDQLFMQAAQRIQAKLRS